MRDLNTEEKLREVEQVFEGYAEVLRKKYGTGKKEEEAPLHKEPQERSREVE